LGLAVLAISAPEPDFLAVSKGMTFGALHHVVEVCSSVWPGPAQPLGELTPAF
jgi:hypothetical protein